MEEDEEIDIIGTEISNLSSGEFLSWDYTVHPKWHTDFTWPENLPRQTSQDEIEHIQDEVVIEEPEPISGDFDWCEENSNNDDIILEEDIPYQSEVVTATAIEDDRFETRNAMIPASTGIVVKSTNPRSLLKSNFVSSTVDHPLTKFKTTLLVNKSLLKSSIKRLSQKDLRKETEFRRPMTAVPKPGSSNNSFKMPPKFIRTMKVKRDDVFQSKKLKRLSKELKNRSRNQKSDRTKVTNSVSGKGKHGKRENRFVDLAGENITINHDAESGSSLDPRQSTIVLREIQTIHVKDDSESDLEIDIESDTEGLLPLVPLTLKIQDSKKTIDKLIKPTVDEITSLTHHTADMKVLSKNREYPLEIANLVESYEIPVVETRLNLTEVTELEKYFHSEFFEGRPTKTLERYLKIRAFIINSWHESKPQYVSKTTVRTGLKHCGDVNCISRIHCLLEQIGAINFGHNGQQFTYIRPLIKLVEMFTQPRQAVRKLVDNLAHKKRQRIKSILSDNNEIDANFTVSHDDGRLVFCNNGRPKKDIEHPRRTRVTLNPEFNLIQCCRFGKDRFAPFKVSITLSTLLCMQLHSLSSKHEVMGFIGGHQSITVGRNKLSLTRYKPCQTSEQSGTMCEMCPVSQVAQSDSLISEGYDLLGWFHSHPAFPPNPSVTDIGTQADMQLQFSLANDRPFIGFILSCIDFKYKCIFILPQDLHTINATTTPYELDVDIIKDCSNFKNEIREVMDFLDRESDDYSVMMNKFAKSANSMLQRFGYGNDILSYLNNAFY